MNVKSQEKPINGNKIETVINEETVRRLLQTLNIGIFASIRTIYAKCCYDKMGSDSTR